MQINHFKLQPQKDWLVSSSFCELVCSQSKKKNQTESKMEKMNNNAGNNTQWRSLYRQFTSTKNATFMTMEVHKCFTMTRISVLFLLAFFSCCIYRDKATKKNQSMKKPQNGQTAKFMYISHCISDEEEQNWFAIDKLNCHFLSSLFLPAAAVAFAFPLSNETY